MAPDVLAPVLPVDREFLDEVLRINPKYTATLKNEIAEFALEHRLKNPLKEVEAGDGTLNSEAQANELTRPEDSKASKASRMRTTLKSIGRKLVGRTESKLVSIYERMPIHSQMHRPKR